MAASSSEDQLSAGSRDDLSTGSRDELNEDAFDSLVCADMQPIESAVGRGTANDGLAFDVLGLLGRGFGVRFDEAMRRAHAIDRRGTLRTGVSAFVVAWEQLPRCASAPPTCLI